MKKSACIVPLILLSMLLTACGIQAIPESKNDVEAALAEITNQYQRRADLIPNLVEVVKGFAKQEKEVLTSVTEARSKATSVTIDPKNLSASEIQKFQSAQGELSQALGRLMMITENYPQLKSDQNFRELQVQLEGTENRITVARQRYIESISRFNKYLTVPPSSFVNTIFYHYEKLPQWTVEDVKTIEKAPEVKL